MEINKIKQIIFDQKEEINYFFANNKIIRRDINIKKIESYLKHPNIVVISGVRRSGKSTLALMLLSDRKYAYLNFDDERLAGFGVDDFNTLLQAFYEIHGEDLDYFIFDEIQNILSWELFINRLRRTKKIIITGSNANLLSGELATHLTGRYIDIVLYPFSFREFLRYKAIGINKNIFSTKEEALIRKKLEEYLRLGGFPEVYKLGQVVIRKLVNDIITKDIIIRHKIKNEKIFRELANYLISNFSEEITYRKLSKVFGIKEESTVKNYIFYLKEVFLLPVLEKFSFKLKEITRAQRKVYSIDTGLANYFSFQFSSNHGRLIENVVLLKLYQDIAKSNWPGEVYYFQDYKGREVDFVIKDKKKIIQLIQVSDNISKIKTKEREIKSLLTGSKELRCDNLLIITMDKDGEEMANGKKIKYVSLWRWLLYDSL